MIDVVGMGPGNLRYMTNEASAAIECAEVLIGAKRHLEKLDVQNKKCVCIDKNLDKVVDYIKANTDLNIAVLASGEPALYGIASYLRKHFEVNVISGISSVQYLFSKISINMNDIYITSTHGKEVDFEFINSLSKVAMVTDRKMNPRVMAKELIKLGSKKKMIVGERLCYEDEKIYCFDDLHDVACHDEFDMNVVVVYD